MHSNVPAQCWSERTHRQAHITKAGLPGRAATRGTGWEVPHDHRVQPREHTTAERIAHARGAVGGHVVGLAALWPTPSDYRDLPRSWGKDLIAGLTVGIVALPLALGFGVASGMGATAGLVTAVVAGLVAAVFGGSHLQVSGPTGAMTVVLLPVIAQYGVGQVPLLALMAGLIVLVMGLAGVGRAVDIIPWPVVEGFTMGIGVIIFLQQLPLVLGSPKGTSESSLVAAYQTVVHTHWDAAVVPLAVTAIVVVLHLLGQRFARSVPISLVSIIVATLLVELANLTTGRIGALPTSLPSPVLPALDLAIMRNLAPSALAVAALAALESLLSARVADGMRPDLSKSNPNRELVGQGLANLASAVFGGLPATGAIARTAVNVRSGARTRMAAVVHAIVLLVVMRFLGPVVALIPMAALGGVLVMTAVRMVNLGLARTITRTTRADRNVFLLTLGCTVLLDLVAAVLLGMGMAAVLSLRHMANNSVAWRQHLPADTHEGLIDFTPEQEYLRDRVAIYRLDGALFYLDARRFVEEVVSVEDVDVVILRCHRMTVLDASGAEGLRDVVKILGRRGIQVIVQGLTEAQARTATIMHAITPGQSERELSDAIRRASTIVDARLAAAALGDEVRQRRRGRLRG